MDQKRFIKVIWAIKASLIVALAYAGMRAIQGRFHVGAFDPGTVSGEEYDPNVRPLAVRTQSPADYTAIQGNLFAGSDDADGLETNTGGSETLDSLPSAEELGLRLVGAVAGGPAISRANIQDAKTNTTGVYKVGDTVASAKVEAIQQDAVVLRHEGRQLVLRLQTGAVGDKQAAKAPEQQAEPKTAQGSKPAALPPVKADYVAEVFRKATIEPYVKNSRTEGLRITGLDKVPMAEAFGFKNGDIIRSVNGQQLTSKQKAFQVLMKARTQSKVDIQLLRNGKSKDLSFDL